jgi:DNA-directed RNA polymerase subunit B
MEVDCLIGHGTSIALRETMRERSDRVIVYVCEECGLIGYYDKNRERYMCPIHKEKATLKPVETTYAFKLLVQELMSMGIRPRLIVGDVSAG